MFPRKSSLLRRRLSVALSMCAAGLPLGLGAQSAPPTARTLLDGYVSEALRANLALAQQQAQFARSNAAVREVRAGYRPSVGINARYSEVSGVVNIGDFINPAYDALNQLIGQSRFPTNVNTTLPFKQESRFELTMPIFNGALRAANAAARAQRDLVGAGTRTVMRQLAADVQLAWLGYASLDRAVATLDATLPLLDENVRVSTRLIAAGQATPDALLRVRAERSEVQQQLDDTRRQRDATRRAFNLLRDKDANTPITLADDSTLLAVDSLSLSALLAHAASHREELAQAGSGIRLADAQKQLATSGYLPSLGFSTSYGIQGNDYRVSKNTDVALANLVFSWNLFNGGQTRARQQQALALRSEAQLRQREAARAIAMQVENAFDGVNTARSALASANDRFVAAERAFALVQRRFAEGLAAPIEFIAARSSFTSSAINQILTRFSFATRVVELERAAALRQLPE